MSNDIKAMQYIYGANTSFNSGDTTYSWTTGANIPAVLRAIADVLQNYPNQVQGAFAGRLNGSDFALDGVPMADGLSLLLGAVLLGYIGAWLAVARHLNELAPR